HPETRRITLMSRPAKVAHPQASDCLAIRDVRVNMAPMNPAQLKSALARVLWLMIVAVALLGCRNSASTSGDEFTRLMILGKSHYDNGEPEKAIAAYQKALSLNPTH